MRKLSAGLVLLFLPLLSICQTKPYEIFGKIEGEYLGKVHLIFDKITATNDSLVAEIKDGKFYFKGTVLYMPILAIFRLSHSPFVRVYIDGPQTHIDFSTKVNVQGNYSSQLFKAVKVSSSHTNLLLFDFEKNDRKLSASTWTMRKKRSPNRTSFSIHQTTSQK